MNAIQERRIRAFKFFNWLAENKVVANLGAGVNILVDSEKATLLIDPDGQIPEGFEDYSLFFIIGAESKVSLEEKVKGKNFSQRNRGN